MATVERSLQAWVEKNTNKATKPQVVTDIFHLPLDIIFHNFVSLEQDSCGDSGNDTADMVGSTEKSANRGLTCLTCKMSFDTRDDQYSHFKSDLHRINLSRKLKGEAPIGQMDIEAARMEDSKLSDDSDEGGPSSGESEDSDTGIEENDNETQDSLSQVYRDKYGEVRKTFSPRFGTAYHLALKSLTPYVLTLSGALFHTNSPFADRRWFDCQNALFPSALQQIQHMRSRPLVAVFILRSGKFGGAIFNPPSTTASTASKAHNASILVHKVIRRYTVRAKAGGGQSSHDNKGGKAKSMGAQLRRYGEKMLEEDVHRLLALWQDYIENCGLILIATTKTLRPLLFDPPSAPIKAAGANVALAQPPLRKDDARIVSVPFAVPQVTLDSMKQVYKVATGVRVTRQEDLSAAPEEADEELIEADEWQKTQELLHRSIEKAQAAPLPPLPPAEEIIRPPCPPADDLLQACQNLPEASLVSHIENLQQELEVDDAEWDWGVVVNYPLSPDFLTPLHIAAQRNLPLAVEALLLAGASPVRQSQSNSEAGLKDLRGRPAYFLCTTKETRNAFRRARGSLGEEKWSWDEGGVPSALTEDVEKAKRDKEKEKKKRAAQRKKEQKEKDERARKELEEHLKVMEVVRQQEKLEREALEKERAGQCAQCNQSLYKKDFFEVFTERCCSTDCVAKWRRRKQAEAALQRMNIKG
eukprot:gene27655-33399_t